jgi:hypothetical protein
MPSIGDQSTKDDHEKNIQACGVALMAAEGQYREAVRAGAHHKARVLNVAIFAVVWNADLSVLLEELRVLNEAPGWAAGWKRKLTARLLALTIVEAVDEFTGLLGRDFRTAVRQLTDDATLEQLNDIHKALTRFRDGHESELRIVRNTIIAHRDPDAAIQTESLRSLNVKHVEELGWELLEWTTTLHVFVGTVAAASARTTAA